MPFDQKTAIIQRYLLPVMLACLTNPVWAADDKGEPPMEKHSKVEQPQTQTRDSKKPQPIQTPRKFTPSEEISADSAVSFPVDI
jgi:hypothetical protein